MLIDSVGAFILLVMEIMRDMKGFSMKKWPQPYYKEEEEEEKAARNGRTRSAYHHYYPRWLFIHNNANFK